MRVIPKGHEPRCVADLRREARRIEVDSGQPPCGDDWSPGGCADTIRGALHDEQGGLCAYCMQRIKPHGYRPDAHEQGGMKIEHWMDRSGHPRRMYDWDNLLGVCGGKYRGPDGLVEHCDTSRRNLALHVNPSSQAPPRADRVFAFRSEPQEAETKARQGIWIHATDPAAKPDIALLNLNADHLVSNRHLARQDLRILLSKQPDEAAVRETLRKRMRSATQPGRNGLPPFAPLIAAYVEAKMRAKGMVF